MKNFTNCLAAFLAALATTGIAQPSSRLQAFGLEGKRVTAMALASALTPRIYLYAATEDEGVYRRNLSHPDSEWVALGLEGRKLIALDVQVWGEGPAVFETPVVTQNAYFLQNDSTLIYLYENQTWVASDSGISRDHYLTALASFASAGHEAPGFSFAVSGDFVYRSNTRSRAWEKVRGYGAIHAPATYALSVRQQSEMNEIWIGGNTGWQLFLPWIAKSADYGATWQGLPLNLNLGIENSCHTIAFHPSNVELVYAGVEGAVIKTMDGGSTWRLTGLHGLPLSIHFTSLTVDPFHNDHIFAAGGENNNPGEWKVWESFDAGSSWKTIPHSWSLAYIGIPKLISDPRAAGVIYIAANGDGVWKYESGSVAVKESRTGRAPVQFEMTQNSPNPFSRAEAQATVIRYQLPTTQQIKVEIYDLLGKRVATLVDRAQAAGEHTVAWNGKDLADKLVPNGIYFYRLSAGGSAIATRKMIMIQ